MGRVLLVAALAGCGFSSPRGGAPADADGAPGVDAPDDAPAGFDPSTCPQDYDLAIADLPGSRYQIITSNAVFASQRPRCATSGLTHLIALETPLEAAAISAALRTVPSPSTNGWYYVGAVQRRNELEIDSGWLWLIDGAVDKMLWGQFGTVAEPDDSNGSENNAQNLAVLDAVSSKLIDVSGSTGYGAVCECDGKATAPAIEDELP